MPGLSVGREEHIPASKVKLVHPMKKRPDIASGPRVDPPRLLWPHGHFCSKCSRILSERCAMGEIWCGRPVAGDAADILKSCRIVCPCEIVLTEKDVRLFIGGRVNELGESLRLRASPPLEYECAQEIIRELALEVIAAYKRHGKTPLRVWYKYALPLNRYSWYRPSKPFSAFTTT